MLHRPPDRFANATFATYEPQNASQAEAQRAAEDLALEIRERQGWWGQLKARWAPPTWKGLYLVGPVGTGKTHLMAAMYHALTPNVPCAFMHSSELFRSTLTPERFARQLARSARVLCLDEVELDDAANEARLVLTLKTLEKLGVILVATSNVEPDKFLSAEFGNDRFRRFLSEEFRKTHRILVVRGEDYRRRLSKPGHAWIGPPDRARPAMQAHCDEATGSKRWLTFDTFLTLSATVRHTNLVNDLLGVDHLYIDGITITHTDDALRLLRVIDDLYTAPSAPTLYFTATTPPDAWFEASRLHSRLEQGIAEKFIRTTSRLQALCEVEDLRLAA